MNNNKINNASDDMNSIIYEVSDVDLNSEEIESVVTDEKKVWYLQPAVGVIEMILILVVLIALVLIFKDELTDLVNNTFAKINAKASQIMN